MGLKSEPAAVEGKQRRRLGFLKGQRSSAPEEGTSLLHVQHEPFQEVKVPTWTNSWLLARLSPSHS